jgi:hypothetical protein
MILMRRWDAHFAVGSYARMLCSAARAPPIVLATEN